MQNQAFYNSLILIAKKNYRATKGQSIERWTQNNLYFGGGDLFSTLKDQIWGSFWYKKTR